MNKRDDILLFFREPGVPVPLGPDTVARVCDLDRELAVFLMEKLVYEQLLDKDKFGYYRATKKLLELNLVLGRPTPRMVAEAWEERRKKREERYRAGVAAANERRRLKAERRAERDRLIEKRRIDRLKHRDRNRLLINKETTSKKNQRLAEAEEAKKIRLLQKEAEKRARLDAAEALRRERREYKARCDERRERERREKAERREQARKRVYLPKEVKPPRVPAPPILVIREAPPPSPAPPPEDPWARIRARNAPPRMPSGPSFVRPVDLRSATGKNSYIRPKQKDPPE